MCSQRRQDRQHRSFGDRRGNRTFDQQHCPACSSTNGGGTLIIHGSGFAAGTAVSFDASRPPHMSSTASTLTASIPPGAVGSPKIVITNPGGVPASLSGAFFYFSPFDPAGGCGGGRSRPMRH